MVKFGFSSAIASLVDLMLFTFVLIKFLPVFKAELIAGFVGMLLNFVLQKRMVFELKRNQYAAFGLSIVFSLLVLLLGGFLISTLARFPLFARYLILTKLFVMGCKFFINYFSKRWVFEKGWLELKDLKQREHSG